ncbi:MAG: 50S ribosomal protein L24 [Patescibacteria group bacterium]
MANFKKGDIVIVLSGADKGKKGKIAKMIPKRGLAVVEGVNMKKKHRKANREGKRGQVISVALPIYISKLALSESKN